MKMGTQIILFLGMAWGSLAVMWFSCKANSDIGLGIGVATFVVSQILFIHPDDIARLKDELIPFDDLVKRGLLVRKMRPLTPYIDARDAARDVKRDEN